MIRLKGFDYKSPFFYMVTLKRRDQLAAFSDIGPKGLIENELTRAFDKVIRSFSLKWCCLEPISPFVIMPDHLHLIIKIKPVTPRKSLSIIVWRLSRELSDAYWLVTKGRSPSLQNPASNGNRAGSAEGGCARLPNIFEPTWHDWIVKKTGQLAAFRRYVKENPVRAYSRRANSQFFQRVTIARFLNRDWFGYGNPEILSLPVIVAFKGHRATQAGSPEWLAAIEAASRIGPGGAAISTFMSPLEKACGNAVAKAGGRLIVLSPEGFSPRWHPVRDKERFCAKGQMLFLSLYEATARQPTKKELYERCHTMVDLAIANLPNIEA